MTLIQHGCTCVPKHEPLSHLPPHNISLGHLRAPAPSILYPASDIDWRFDSYMITYMFQCHSPKSSHPLPLPLSPKVCSTHLCLFCCLAHRVVFRGQCNRIPLAQASLCPRVSTGYALKGGWMLEQVKLQVLVMPVPLFGMIPWKKKWQPTPVFLPKEFYGQRSLVGYTVHGVPKSRTRLKD